MLKERYTATKSWVSRHPRRFIAISLGTVFFGCILFQFIYPTTSLVPFSSIEGVSVGGISKEKAIKELDERFNASEVAVYFDDDSESAFLKATPGELGIASSNEERIQAVDYPFYLRLIPSSIFWMHLFTDNVDGLQYQRNQEALTSFINQTFGDACHLEPKNATLEVKDEDFEVVEARAGGDCDFSELTTSLSSVSPTVQGGSVTISGDSVAPAVTTKDAQVLADHVTQTIQDGISINDGKNRHAIPKELLYKWIDFAVAEGKLDYSFNAERAESYLGERIASTVERSTGEMTITLKDFAEASRTTGQSGVVFNEVKMLGSMKAALEKGEKEVAVEVDIIPPTVKYVRTYSEPDAALSALIKKYAETHRGTYGVSLRELSGARRNASYRSTTQYTTASTYKLFVAYSTLLRVESGAYHWTDYINGGRNLRECFDDMIELSDNECAVALLLKAGRQAVTDEAHAIGAVNTSFMGKDGIKSTAEDESLLLGLLQSGQILSQQPSRDVWIAAMKGNVYRQGIPKGIPSATVADKVGFLDAWLHDASIVYSPNGTYVLIILTESASWANIAELAGEIEALRIKS